MRILEVKQGSSQWLSIRSNSITATDFAVIAAAASLSVNIFKKSVNSVLKRKITEQKQKDNRFFAMGRQWENYLLHSANALDLIKGEVITYDSNDRIMASLDGRDAFINAVIEAKTTTKDVSKVDELIQYYQYQVIHQCYIAGSDLGILIIGVIKDGKIELIRKDIIPSEIMNKETWLSMCNENLAKLDFLRMESWKLN